MLRQRHLHEITPDRQRGIRAGEPELRAVIEANPDDTNEIGCVAGKPTITRSSRLARNVGLQSTRSHLGGSAAIHNILQERSHHVSNIRTQDFILLRRWRRDGHSLARGDATDCNGRRARSQSGK